MFPSQFANIFLTYQTFVTNLHLLRVELHCKLQEKFHHMTGPLYVVICLCFKLGQPNFNRSEAQKAAQ